MAGLRGRIFIISLLAFLISSVSAPAGTVILQATTSTQNSGLLDEILPKFTADTGINVRVVVVGTGQALVNGRNGDADVLLVHARERELAFVANGYGVARHFTMANDFVIVGPDNDPAGICGCESAVKAMQHIAEAEQSFISRGDESGTHVKEQQLWQEVGIEPGGNSTSWYREIGGGMGATLNIASSLLAYTIADSATWAAFSNRSALRLLCEDHKILFNPYGLILVNPERHKNINAEDGQKFIDWMMGQAGQNAIRAFQIEGQGVFVPAVDITEMSGER